MKDKIKKISAYKFVSKIINVSVITDINFLYILIILSIARFLFLIGFGGNYFFFFLFIMILSSLPALGYVLDRVDSKISPVSYGDLYVKTVESILNVESFDKMLQKTFNQVMQMMMVKTGRLIFYHHDSDVFEIYYQKNKPVDIMHRERNSYDKLILDLLKGSDDIILKNNLPGIPDISIINALEARDIFNSDIVLPIYYNSNVFGLLLIGEKQSFSEREVRLLKIFTSKMAMLSINSYYFSEILKKRELEKEYELTYKIQRQFLPYPSLQIGRINVRAFHKSAASLTSEFYDIFVENGNSDEIRISAYRVHGDVKETSIFMPGVQAVLQSFTRLKFSPNKTVSRLKKMVLERDVLNGELIIFHSSIKQNGEFKCCCSGYPTPFFFKRSDMQLVHLAGVGSGIKKIRVIIEPGDIIIVACRTFYEIIRKNIQLYSVILKRNYFLKLNDLKSALINTINDQLSLESHNSALSDEEEDTLLILVGLEDRP